MNHVSLSAIKELKTLAENHNELPARVPLPELFSDKFMSKYTEFANIERLSRLGGISIGPNGTLVVKNKKLLNELILERTVFTSWSEMLLRAGREYLAVRN